MIDRPFYYNNPLDVELKGLNRDQVITCLTEQKDKRLGLFMVIQAVAFIAISCVAFAAVAYFSQSAFKAVVLSAAGFVIGGGSAYLFYNHFFVLTKVVSDLRTKYKGEGEIAFSDLEKILAVSDESTQEKLIKQMSFEQAVIARQFTNPDKFKMWVKGADWSAVFNFNEEKIGEYGPIIEKNRWVLRAIEPHLGDKQIFNLSTRNLRARPSDVFGLINFLETMQKQIAEGVDIEAELPISDLVKTLMSREYVELDLENIKSILNTAEWFNSGELFRFIDEHVYSHIDQYNQNDLIELVQTYPSLIQTKSYMARQILSRNITLDNWRELWMLAAKVAKSELREIFSQFISSNYLINDIEIVKEVFTAKKFQEWLQSHVGYDRALELFKEELKNPTGYLEAYFKIIEKWKIDLSIFSVTDDNFLLLSKLPAFKKDVDNYIQANWKALLLDNKVTIETLLEISRIKKEVLTYLKENHSELIEKKIITKLAWKDYKFIYFS